jgi:gliding motility-associated-like protein
LPNGVTPNNDGQNDYYVIRGIDGKMQSDFKVFNRWGNLVYSKTNYDNTWKGQSDGGDDLPNGTYFVVFVTGNKEFNTYVDLRR